MGRRVAIVGAGQTDSRGRHDNLDVPGLARQAMRGALESADLASSAIESYVIGIAPEAFEGVNNPDKWIVGAIGATGKPTFRVHTGGTTGAAAALAAIDLVSSGQADLVAVVAVQRIGQSPDAQKILNTIWDPIYERDFSLNTIVLASLRSARAMQAHGITEEHWAAVSVRNHANGAKNSRAHIRKNVTVDDVMRSPMLTWPIKRLDACPRSEAACAIIVASEDVAKKMTPNPVWVQGYGSASDTYYIGDRLGTLADSEFLDAAALRKAGESAYAMAGIKDPTDELDVVELYAPFTSSETQAFEALGFCERGQAKTLVEKDFGSFDSPVVMNPSGGVQCSNPIGATGLIRIAELFNQLTGTAGPIQVPDARRGLATAAGGSSQFYSVTIMGLDRPE